MQVSRQHVQRMTVPEKERVMKQMNPASAPARIALAILVLFVVSSAASAKEKAAKPADVPATVVAHVPLPSDPGSQMMLQRKGTKQYLYVQQASKQGFMIVDVSKANQPNVLKRTATTAQATSGDLEMVGPDVALSETPEKNSGAGSVSSVPRPAESVRVLDMSDPANPKTLQTFDAVTSILTDSGRIYLTNNEGLWILKYSQYQKRQLPPCDSSSAFSPIADCQ
jgi:hypothetical protein